MPSDTETEILALTDHLAAAAGQYQRWQACGERAHATLTHAALSEVIRAAGRANAALAGEEVALRDHRAEIDRMTGGA